MTISEPMGSVILNQETPSERRGDPAPMPGTTFISCLLARAGLSRRSLRLESVNRGLGRARWRADGPSDRADRYPAETEGMTTAGAGAGDQSRAGCVRPRQTAGSAAGAGRSLPLPADQAPRQCSGRSEEHTSELQSLMRISYAVF